jgi:hypothetical protein
MVLPGLLALTTALAWCQEDAVFWMACAALLTAGAWRIDAASWRGWRKADWALVGLMLSLPAWGVAQLAGLGTVIPFETARSSLRWLTLGTVFCWGLGQPHPERVLRFAAQTGVALAALMLLQLHTSHGRFLWWFDSGYSDVIFGSFPSHNNYAQFVELILPVVLVLAGRGGRLCLLWWAGAALLLASVAVSGSRTGLVLGLGETTAIFCLAYRRQKANRNAGPHGLRGTGVWAALAALALGVAYSAGWARMGERWAQTDLTGGREPLLRAALALVRERPAWGSGLGTFAGVYPSQAVVDWGADVEHAHNDWAEFAVEGGIGFAVLVAAPFLWGSRAAIRSGWGIGILAVLLHACVDYPFPRLAVSGWLYLLLGLVLAWDRQTSGEALSPSADKTQSRGPAENRSPRTRAEGLEE